MYFNKPVSTTFHGRDIMAPVGAHITRGIPIIEFGAQFEVDKILDYPLHYNTNENEKKIECVIQYIDSFGNGITNVPIRNNFIKGTSLFLKHDLNIKIDFRAQSYDCRYVSHFGSVPINTLILLKGSTNFLEISKNQANAATSIGFNVGDIITINL
jgi:S-adenosylmethionine hydrolase